MTKKIGKTGLEEIKKAVPQIEERDLKQSLKTYFSEKEKLQMTVNISMAIGELADKKSEAKSVAERYKSQVTELEMKISSLASSVRSGWEMRYIQCKEIKNFQNGTYQMVRVNTGEIVEERALTLEERQQKLALEKKEKEKALEDESLTKGPPEEVDEEFPDTDV